MSSVDSELLVRLKWDTLYIKMLKIQVGPRGQIDQKLKCCFSNNLFLAENIFYYYAILLLCNIIIMFYNFYVTHIRYKNYKLLCRNSIALSYFCATNFVTLQRLFIIRERILMAGLLFTASIKKMPMYTKVRFEQS